MSGRQFHYSVMFLAWAYATLVGFLHPEYATPAVIVQVAFVAGAVVGMFTSHCWRERLWGRK